MIRVDSRIITAETLDKSRTVLVDAHSLSTAGPVLAEREVPRFHFSSFANDPGRALANVIQTIVLYETVVVDSTLLYSHSAVDVAFDLFPNVFRGVYLRDRDRMRIAHWVQQATRGWDEAPPGLSSEDWAALQRQTASEKPIFDGAEKSFVHAVPPGFENDPEVQHSSEQEVYVPLCVLTSTRTLSRAHFYLEFARQLDIPLIVDPIRSRYFKALFQNVKKALKEGTPEKIIATFEGSVLRPEVGDNPSVDLSIPAVAELVLRVAQRQKCSLLQATAEVRESKNAIAFRKWCAKFASFEREGRPGAKQQVEMLAQLDDVCRIWRSDLKEGVDYKVRKINLEHLPIVGGVLKALNMQQTLTIKDPILKSPPRNAYFLFLNDLLRP